MKKKILRERKKKNMEEWSVLTALNKGKLFRLSLEHARPHTILLRSLAYPSSYSQSM
jgi:hypothetical protein